MSQANNDEKKTSGPIPPESTPSGSSQPALIRTASNTTAGPSKIIGSQAKKQEDVTRHGTQKMKFIPTLPVRRKKPEDEVKQEEAPAAPSNPTERGRGRGRGRGLGRGRGGPPPPRPEMQMVASGPFAMGPALAGSSGRRPRSNFTPVMPMGPGGSAALGEGLSRTTAPALEKRKEKEKESVKEEDVEVYSDPDEGVQIVDMDAVKTMDWMAPESLRRERNDGKKTKKKKVEIIEKDAKEKRKAKGGEPQSPFNSQLISVIVDVPDVEPEKVEAEKNLANALDLSESEEEEEMEDLIEDFAIDNFDEDSLTRQEKLYFFQFPQPFPTFSVPEEGDTVDVDAMAVDDYKLQDSIGAEKGKKVSFAPDAKPPAPNGQHDPEKGGDTSKDGAKTASTSVEKSIDGVIGQLEVHRSGMIKMRLNNGMLLDVTAATQPSFLQHAVFLDPTAKKMHVIGEVNRRFMVSPDVDKLLEELDKVEVAGRVKLEGAATPMDTT
ncbi:hypothetical protein K439DRAFT_1661677 [Ramaria rubella]|nr:hypothetical protein K439DRAFT_1661677 [Ramaria rubella]